MTEYRRYRGAEPYVGEQFVGVDLHRRRSVVVRLTAAGERLSAVQIANDPDLLVAEVAVAGVGASVAIEATNGWYWAVDALQAAGFRVQLVHPLGQRQMNHRRHKDDVKDAHDLAETLRLDGLATAWIAPPAVRELRELVRYRHKLVDARSRCKAQVHGVLAKVGLGVKAADLFGTAARAWLERVGMPGAYAARVASLLGQIDSLDGEVDRFDRMISQQLSGHVGYRAIQTIPGIGPVTAAVLVAEIGEISRFSNPAKLASWAGLTPTHHESDGKAHKGRITKQGSKLVRWALVESVQRYATGTIAEAKTRIETRRGKNIAKVAAARMQLRLVYYGLRDHHIRALNPPTNAAA